LSDIFCDLGVICHCPRAFVVLYVRCSVAWFIVSGQVEISVALIVAVARRNGLVLVYHKARMSKWEREGLAGHIETSDMGALCTRAIAEQQGR
jgi:hypothetical protein